MTYQTCSWCHTPTPLGHRTCPECGHDADRPRLDCSCHQCRRGGQPGVVLGGPRDDDRDDREGGR